MLVLAGSGDGVAIVLFVALFAIASMSLYFKNKEKERRHAERLKALELGAALPPDPTPVPQPHRGALLGGILAISLALAFFLVSRLSFGLDTAVESNNMQKMMIPAIILGCLGAGFLAFYFLSKRKS